ncbi:MAG: site-2 protease family protein [Acidobacteria bacterium]|nr:site-2 protease family protein [Acidobacteriota bacterium]
MPVDPWTPGALRPPSSSYHPLDRTWTEAAPPRRTRSPLRLHLMLFALTVLSTWMVQALGTGGWSWIYAFYYVGQGGDAGLMVVRFFDALAKGASAGFEYSFWLLFILTSHEFGHYFAAKAHRVKATLPYFIPLPLPPLGTMGAVIRMSAYIPNRRALFDIAVAGPLAGIVVALPVAWFGIRQAVHAPVQALAGGSLYFGDPLIFRIFEYFTLGPRPEGYELLIGPMAFAGWVGCFVTALNLLPISQLDGGHISYAVFGSWSRKVATAVFVGMGVMMLFNGPSYILILALAWFAGIGHPPTMDDSVKLGPKRVALAWLALVIFILCFTPTPMAEWQGQ